MLQMDKLARARHLFPRGLLEMKDKHAAPTIRWTTMVSVPPMLEGYVIKSTLRMAFKVDFDSEFDFR